jgi:WhiB family redox-sensing transcriptional regulator
MEYRIMADTAERGHQDVWLTFLPPPAGGHDPFWRERRACKDADPELFFPTRTKGATARTRQARGICGGCPVRRECLNEALVTFQDVGVWGGTTPKERRKMFPAVHADLAAQADRRACVATQAA